MMNGEMISTNVRVIKEYTLGFTTFYTMSFTENISMFNVETRDLVFKNSR